VVTHPEESYSAVCLSAIVKPGQGRDPGPVGAVASCGGGSFFFLFFCCLELLTCNAICKNAEM